jgi:hypothetical protein
MHFDSWFPSRAWPHCSSPEMRWNIVAGGHGGGAQLLSHGSWEAKRKEPGATHILLRQLQLPASSSQGLTAQSAVAHPSDPVTSQ